MIRSGMYIVGELLGYDESKNPQYVIIKVYDSYKVNRIIAGAGVLNGVGKGDEIYVKIRLTVRRKRDESGKERVDISYFAQELGLVSDLVGGV